MFRFLNQIVWSIWGNKLKRILYEQVKQVFENEQYELLSKEYINKNKYLDFICPNGHRHKITFGSWKQGHRCRFCHGNQKISYGFIKQSFESEGYKLISKEYKNAYSYLSFICPIGHKHKIKWYSWKQGTRCGKCSNFYNITYKQVKESFEKEKYILLSTEYINAHSYLDFICPNGHKHKIKWHKWQDGQRCGKCDIKWSKNEKEIYEYIKRNYNGTIIPNDRTLIQNPKTKQFLELDIWLPDIRKAIEYNGSYWHNNKYQQWKDNYKKEYCQENDINLLVINEKEWMQNKDWNNINIFVGVE